MAYELNTNQVRRLIAEQFPEWANLSVKPVEFGGWDNKTFHLGDNMLVRLPSATGYADQVEKEHRWLPKLAPHLPLPIPTPLAMGKPAEGYPWHWSIYRWIDGETASFERIADLSQFARSLAEFLTALQKIDSKGGPVAGTHNFHRGGSLETYDVETRQAIATCGSKIDSKAATQIWETALASSWQSSRVWVHGDVAATNLLVSIGQLSAVIDFGCMGIGDPACDLVIAWTLFKDESREVFRQALSLDQATWERARGWALWKALITADKSKRVIEEVLAWTL
ncbi:MAG: aminoglycoside phosphotransferase family protein [Myxococcota bacterium]